MSNEKKAPAPAQTTEKCPQCGSTAKNTIGSTFCGSPDWRHPWHLEAAASGPQNDRNSPTLLFIGNWLAEKNDDRLIRSRIRFNHFEVAEIAESYAASLRSQLSKANEELKWRRGTAELMRQAVNGQLASLRESWNAEVAVSSGLRSQLEQVTKERDSARNSYRFLADSTATTELNLQAELARVRQERDTQRDGWNAEKLDHADSIVRWAAVESELSAIKKESR